MSVDALRGFDMFWIIGGDYLVRSLVNIYDSPVTRQLAAQMDHCRWAGFHFYDLIFPMFLWIVGVAIPFSLPRLIEQKGTAPALARIVIRSGVLFLLGVFYHYSATPVSAMSVDVTSGRLGFEPGGIE